jgi:F-type H+-transporting ATPase subunit delta
MAVTGGQETALARVYAASILELAEAAGKADAVRDELVALAEAVAEHRELGDVFSNPTVDTDARRRVIEKLLRGKSSDLVVDALQVLNNKERLELVPAVAEAYRRLHEDLRGRVEVEVTSAVPLSAAHRKALRELATSKTGKEADLLESVDPALLGGVVIRIGDEKFDMSVATQLHRIGELLVTRASREAHAGRTFCEGSAA